MILYQKTKLVPAAGNVDFIVAVDGKAPLTLMLANVDMKAALVMREGGTDVGDNTVATRAVSYVTQRAGKNACLLFENVPGGAAAAVKTLAITLAANQAFSIVDLTSDDWKINLACGADGQTTQTASQVLKAIENDVTVDGLAFKAAINTTLAPGSDGSAQMLSLDGSTTRVIADATALLGGSDSTTTGTTTISVGPGTDGPWVAITNTDLNAVANDTMKTTTLTTPNPAIKVNAAIAATGTWVTLTVAG